MPASSHGSTWPACRPRTCRCPCRWSSSIWSSTCGNGPTRGTRPGACTAISNTRSTCSMRPPLSVWRGSGSGYWRPSSPRPSAGSARSICWIATTGVCCNAGTRLRNRCPRRRSRRCSSDRSRAIPRPLLSSSGRRSCPTPSSMHGPIGSRTISSSSACNPRTASPSHCTAASTSPSPCWPSSRPGRSTSRSIPTIWPSSRPARSTFRSIPSIPPSASPSCSTIRGPLCC